MAIEKVKAMHAQVFSQTLVQGTSRKKDDKALEEEETQKIVKMVRSTMTTK